MATRPQWVQQDHRDTLAMKALFAWMLADNATCIDVGAHTGSTLREIVRCAPHGQHYAFEALPHLASQLIADFPTVDVRSCAVGSAPGRAEFVHVLDAPAYSGLLERAYPEAMTLERIDVPVTTLDREIPDHVLPALIKVDVEGAELEVFRGAAALLARARPAVLFEFGHGAANVYGATPASVHELLADLELRIFDLDGNGPYTVDHLEDAYHTRSYWNFIAHT